MHSAEISAIQIAEVAGVRMVRAPRMLDTACSHAPAYVALMYDTNGVVVYEDDPYVVVSVGNYPGRFIRPQDMEPIS